MQQLIFTNDVAAALSTVACSKHYNRIFVLVDENTSREVLPHVQCDAIAGAHVITIPAGDTHKNLDTLTHVWTELDNNGGTRHSLLINLGGGVVTDLGGMAAATFKRGIDFVNCPTTLLSAVDAAVGGKTGINFNGLKNELGVFCEANAVIISTCFFATLPQSELKSGYAEMLKHGMLDSEDEFARLLGYDIQQASLDQLLSLLETSVKVKQRIVEQDPHEKGLRRALNLGHTVGHAFESMAMHRGNPIPHGYAVAWGMVAETVLSHMKMKMASASLHRLAQFVRDNYGAFYITCDDYPELLNYMHHDKKSVHGEINCSLLRSCGDIETGVTVTDDDMKAALDIYRDLMGI